MTDAQFRAQVERDAVACGWSRDIAALLARHVGRPVPVDDHTPRASARLRVVSASRPKYEVTLDRAVQMFGLPAGMAAQFRAAGLTTADAAGPLLGRYFRAAARRPADARAALALDLTARKQWRPKV